MESNGRVAGIDNRRSMLINAFLWLLMGAIIGVVGTLLVYRVGYLSIIIDNGRKIEFTLLNVDTVLRHIKSDPSLKRAVIGQFIKGDKDFVPSKHKIEVGFSQNIQKGQAAVCQKSDFYTNRLELFAPASGLTLALEGTQLLERRECDESPNRYIQTSYEHRSRIDNMLNGDGIISAKAVPIIYKEVPVNQKES